MAVIACGHCGGTHGSVAEVRACSTEHPADTPPEDPGLTGGGAPDGPPGGGPSRSTRPPSSGSSPRG
ncbi:MAG: hypothetical protein AAFO29_04510, partial [Actinomycetota bacterium]